MKKIFTLLMAMMVGAGMFATSPTMLPQKKQALNTKPTAAMSQLTDVQKKVVRPLSADASEVRRHPAASCALPLKREAKAEVITLGTYHKTYWGLDNVGITLSYRFDLTKSLIK